MKLSRKGRRGPLKLLSAFGVVGPILSRTSSGLTIASIGLYFIGPALRGRRNVLYQAPLGDSTLHALVALCNIPPSAVFDHCDGGPLLRYGQRTAAKLGTLAGEPVSGDDGHVLRYESVGGRDSGATYEATLTDSALGALMAAIELVTSDPVFAGRVYAYSLREQALLGQRE